MEYEGKLWISEFHLFYSANADGKKELRRKFFLTLNRRITKFWLFLFLFGMNCFLKELSQINILATVL